MTSKSSGKGDNLPQNSNTLNHSPGSTGVTHSLKQTVDDHINQIYKTVLGTDKLLEILQVMNSLLCNIISKPEEQKYKTLKLSNPKIAATIGSCPAAVSMFRHLCFVDSGDSMLQFAGEDISELDYAARSIREFAEKIGRFFDDSSWSPEKSRSRRYF